MDWRRLMVFLTTFISYGLFHTSRKTLSGVKATISKDWTQNVTINETIHHKLFNNDADAKAFLGGLDAIFMTSYALALFFWGGLGDRLDPRNIVVFGMIGSGVTLVLFGSVPKWANFYSIPYYIVTYILFGFIQGSGWPNEIAIMANWFGKTNRGVLLGLWACCQPLGNIVGSMIIALILPLGYANVFAANALLIAVGGIVVAFCITSSPLSTHTTVIDSDDRDVIEQHSQIVDDYNINEPPPPPISFVRAILLPGVLAYCCCNACLKLVNYAFFFWLPLYLNGKYGWPETVANQLSIWYDIGGIIGSIAGGLISDRIGYRSPVIFTLLVMSLAALYGYSDMPAEIHLNALVMTIVGICVSGPYNLIVGTISVDLGSQPILAGNARAMSTVTGLVDGTGSVGSAIGQILVPLIENSLGWVFVFYMFIIVNFLATLCLLKRFIFDIKSIINDRRIVGRYGIIENVNDDETQSLIQ